MDSVSRRSAVLPVVRAVCIMVVFVAARAVEGRPVTAHRMMQVCSLASVEVLASSLQTSDMTATVAESEEQQHKKLIIGLCQIGTSTPLKDIRLDHLLKHTAPRRAIEQAEDLGWLRLQAGQPGPLKALAPAPQLKTSLAAGAGFESALLWGLSEFLVKRAKAQVDTWVLDEVRKVCDEPVFEKTPAKRGDGEGTPSVAANSKRQRVTIQELLPQTCKMMSKDILPDLLGGMTTLRASLRKDMTALPSALGKSAAKALCASGDAKACDGAVTLSLVGAIAQRVAAGTAPLDAVLGLPEPEWSKDWAVDELSAKDTPTALHIVRAVHVLQALAIVEPGGKLRLDKPEPGKVDDFALSTVRASVVNALAFRQARKKADQDKKAGQESWEDLLPPLALKVFMEPGNNGVERARLSAAVESLVATGDEAFERFKRLAEMQNRLDRRSQLQALGFAVEGALQFLEAAAAFTSDGPLAEQLRKDLKRVALLTHSLTEPDYGALVAEVLSMALESKLGTEAQVARLLSFGVELAQAQDAVAMESAFEHFAAPAGSFKGKRTRRWYVTLNAYVGGFAGRESSELAPDVLDKGSSFAAWAPIGFEVGKSVEGYSLGLFLHVLDVGALASHRVREPESPIDDAPKVSLDQVLSPGAFLVLGLKDLPVSIAAGASYAPRLRVIGGGSPETPNYVGALRFGVSIAVDIPLFP